MDVEGTALPGTGLRYSFTSERNRQTAGGGDLAPVRVWLSSGCAYRCAWWVFRVYDYRAV